MVVDPFKDPIHVNTRCVDGIGIQVSRLHQRLHFGDGDPGSRGHQGVEVSGGLPIDQVAGTVSPMSLDEGEVRLEGKLQDVMFAFNGTGFLALGNHGPVARGREESTDPGSSGADTLGKGSLGT